MAGAYAEITVDTATPAVSNAIEALEGEGLQRMLDDIGEHLFQSTKTRAARQVSPDGTMFAPLSASYARRKRAVRPLRPILRFDNHMIGDQLSHQVVGETLYVGTNAIYGAAHQFGYRGIPARPWLGISDEDAVAITEIAREHLSGMFSE